MIASPYLRNVSNRVQQALQLDPRFYQKCRDAVHSFSFRNVLLNFPSFIWQNLFVPFTITPNTSYYSCLLARVIMAQYIFVHSTKTCVPIMRHPIGFGKLFDITQFCSESALAIERPILFIFLFLYACNKLPILSLTYILWFLTMVYQSINGNGTIFHGYQVVALVLVMQWAGHIFLYIRNRWFKPTNENPGMYGNITEDAFIFRLSGLALCGIYMTSAISKHHMSKGKWFTHAEYFITNFVSVNEREYYNRGIKGSDFTSVLLPQILSAYPILARWFFGSAFIFEAIAPLFLYNRFWMLVGGIITWFMHEGIAITMRLTFVSHQRVLTAYLIDPVYWIQLIYFFLLDYYQCRVNLRKNSSGDDLKDSSAVAIQTTPEAAPSSHVSKNYRSRNQSLLARTLAFIWRFPFKSMVVFIIVCLYMKETFPFSNFPMYGSPPVRGDYFFISDKNDNPLFTADNFYMTGAQMKRSFFFSCKKHLDTNSPMLFRTNKTTLEFCGNKTLEFFSQITRPERRDYVERLKPWKLNWVYIELNRQDLSVSKNVSVIATIGPDETYLAAHPVAEQPRRRTESLPASVRATTSGASKKSSGSSKNPSQKAPTQPKTQPNVARSKEIPPKVAAPKKGTSSKRSNSTQPITQSA